MEEGEVQIERLFSFCHFQRIFTGNATGGGFHVKRSITPAKLAEG